MEGGLPDMIQRLWREGQRPTKVSRQRPTEARTAMLTCDVCEGKRDVQPIGVRAENKDSDGTVFNRTLDLCDGCRHNLVNRLADSLVALAGDARREGRLPP